MRQGSSAVRPTNGLYLYLLLCIQEGAGSNFGSEIVSFQTCRGVPQTLQQPDGQFIRFRHNSCLNTSFRRHYSVTNRGSDCDCLACESSGACSYETEPFAHQHIPSNEYLRVSHPGYDITRTQGTPTFALL